MSLVRNIVLGDKCLVINGSEVKWYDRATQETTDPHPDFFVYKDSDALELERDRWMRVHEFPN